MAGLLAHVSSRATERSSQVTATPHSFYEGFTGGFAFRTPRRFASTIEADALLTSKGAGGDGEPGSMDYRDVSLLRVGDPAESGWPAGEASCPDRRACNWR